MAAQPRSRWWLIPLLAGVLAVGTFAVGLLLLAPTGFRTASLQPPEQKAGPEGLGKAPPDMPFLGGVVPGLARHAQLSAERSFLGQGNAAACPPELLAVLGDTRFRVPVWPGAPVYSPDGKLLAVPAGYDVFLFDAATGVLTDRLVGHFGAVLCVAFRPDSRQLASGAEDRTLRLWDLDTGLERPVALGHAHHVSGLAWSPDGKRLASGALDGSVILWDADAGQQLAACQGHTDWVHSVAFHPHGATFATGAADHTVRVWDAATGRLLHTLPHHERGTHLTVAYSPDGKRLAGGSDAELRLWDASAYTLLHSVETPAAVLAFHADSLFTGPLVAAGPHAVRRWDAESLQERQVIQLGTRGRMSLWGLSPDGKTLAAAGYPDERVVRRLDVETGKPIDPGEAGHVGQVECIVFSADGKHLFSCSGDRTIRVWRLADGHCLHTLTGHTNEVRGLALSPDGKTLASASHDRTVRLWDVEKGAPVAVLEGHGFPVESVAWAPDGRVLAAGGERGLVSLWDATTYRRRWLKGAGAATVEGMCFTPDGEQILCSADNGLAVREVSSGEVVDTLPATGGALVPALLPDGYRVAAGGWTGAVTVWSLRGGAVEYTFRGAWGAVHQVAAAPNGKLLAAAGQDGAVRLWGLEGPEPTCLPWVLRPGDNWLSAVQFSPDGSQLAVGMPEGTIALFRTPEPPARREHMTEVRRFEKHTHEYLETCAVLPDGKRAVSGGFDLKLFVWDLETGEELRRIEGHTGGIVSVAALPDDKRALTGSADTTLRLWDLDTGAELKRLEGHTAQVRKVAVSADGRWAASGAEDKTVRLWDLDAGKQARQFDGHTNAVWSVALSADGTRLLSGSEDHTVRLWDAGSGKQLRVWERVPGGVWALAFTPDGKRAAWGDGVGRVCLWDLETGARLSRWAVGGWPVRGIAFSPDGTQLLATGFEGLVVLIDVTTGQVRDRAQTPPALTVAWTPSATGAISTHTDKKVRVWRLPAPQTEIVPLPGE